MDISTTSISCGVSQLFGLATNDLGTEFHSAIRRKLQRMAQDNKTNNQWLRSRNPQGKYPPETLAGLLKDPEWYNRLFPAHYIFSDADSYHNGRRFEAFIKDNKLGTVVSCESKLNINSGNTITTWIWVVDKEACVKWIIDNATGVNFISGLVDGDEGEELNRLLALLSQQIKDKDDGCTCPSCRPSFDNSIIATQDKIDKVRKKLAASKSKKKPSVDVPAPMQAAG